MWQSQKESLAPFSNEKDNIIWGIHMLKKMSITSGKHKTTIVLENKGWKNNHHLMVQYLDYLHGILNTQIFNPLNLKKLNN
jgi:hypothetical protein